MSRERFREDIQAVRTHDPATGIRSDVLLHSGIYALLLHRIAHQLWQSGWRLLARSMSQLNRWLTGIEIHPAAILGRRVYFWPGGGVVIGETTIIGDDVVIANDVTLGGTGKERGKRHPTIGNCVIIEPGARILGAITIGIGARIESGAVVIRPVPPGVTAIGIPARLIPPTNEYPMLRASSVDPYDRVLECLAHELQDLERRVSKVALAMQHDTSASDTVRDHMVVLVES